MNKYKDIKITIKNNTSLKNYNSYIKHLNFDEKSYENLFYFCTIHNTNITFNTNHRKNLLSYIKELEMNFEIFRRAYINQRKIYKLLRAYTDLNNEIINEDEYDYIEELCMIKIQDNEEYFIEKVLHNFLKFHKDFDETYSSAELSELLNFSYKKVNKIIRLNKDANKN